MNHVGGWKHPEWIEFDERYYWEDRGLITETPYFGNTEEELWMEKLKEKILPLHHSTGFAPNAKVTIGERFQFLTILVRSLWKGFWSLPAPL
jgi:hypothetical protein